MHVKNSMQDNGTSIHWHGIRQNFTNMNDGVTAVTQCPTAPGESMTYTFRATQYGTSWWHSHFYVQAWDGVFGGMIINGPHSGNWDEDKGVITLADWDHDTADNLVLKAVDDGPPTMANGLIDGKNVYEQDGTVLGERYTTTFESGTKYLLRLVNVAADTHFKFTIDNHTMEVVSADFVPIVPYTTDVLNIAIGQRYEVIVSADAAVGDYWMRAIAQTACSDNENPNNIMGIIRYDNSSTSDPTSTVTSNAAVDECVDEPAASLVPYLQVDASDSADVEENFAVSISYNANRFYWSMGNATFYNDWDYPTVQQLLDGNDTWADVQNVNRLPNANEWVYWIVQTDLGVPHPMHLHGHDFWVLGSGEGDFDASTASLSYTNTPRRDVVLLPASGWVAFAFYTDNPGVSLFDILFLFDALANLPLFFYRSGLLTATLLGTHMPVSLSRWWSARLKFPPSTTTRCPRLARPGPPTKKARPCSRKTLASKR